jgi:hypothetical protein
MCKQPEWDSLSNELSLYIFNRKAQKINATFNLPQEPSTHPPHHSINIVENNYTQLICNGDKVLMQCYSIWL